MSRPAIHPDALDKIFDKRLHLPARRLAGGPRPTPYETLTRNVEVPRVQLEQISVREIALPLLEPFASAVGTETVRRVLLVEVRASSWTGYGEVSALSAPYYTEETLETARYVLETFLIPLAFRTEWHHPSELAARLTPIRRHYTAKAGLEAAAWDLHARSQGVSLAASIGGTRLRIESGVAVGLDRNVDRWLKRIERYVALGYRRIKVKIEPGWDCEPLHHLRRAFGQVPVAVDANSAYTLGDIEHLRRLDEFGLLMIEQPLAHDDIVDHAALQKRLDTPICLDESILSADDARKALDLGSCRVINVKPGRVGGISEAIRIHDLCRARGVPVWCGGLLESGVGRAHNIALASLPGFSLPGDLSASDRYFARDIVEPPVTLRDGGYIDVPSEPGIGYRLDTEALEAATVSLRQFEP